MHSRSDDDLANQSGMSGFRPVSHRPAVQRWHLVAMSLLPRPVWRRYRVQQRTELLFVPPVVMETPPVTVAPASPPAADVTKQSDAWAWHVYAAFAIAVAAP